MLNQVILVGRLLETPILEKSEEGKVISKITLAVPRDWKNVNGEHEIDYFDCITFENAAKTTVEYCQKGDIVGVKGRLQKSKNDKEVLVIAEKVTFLNTRKKEKEEEEII